MDNSSESTSETASIASTTVTHLPRDKSYSLQSAGAGEDICGGVVGAVGGYGERGEGGAVRSVVINAQINRLKSSELQNKSHGRHESIDDDELKEVDTEEHRESLGRGIPLHLAQPTGPKFVRPRRDESSVDSEDSCFGSPPPSASSTSRHCVGECSTSSMLERVAGAAADCEESASFAAGKTSTSESSECEEVSDL